MCPGALKIKGALVSRQPIQQGGNFFRRTDVFDRHPEEFITRVAVVHDGRVIDGQKTQRLFIVDIHRARISVEQNPILFLRFGGRKAHPATTGFRLNVHWVFASDDQEPIVKFDVR